MATLQRPPTSPGLLSEARHLVLPDGITSSGFPAVQATCRKIGIEFDPWQQDMNRCVLAKDRHGFYAADTVVISICRQAGKTFDIGGLVFADSIINPGTTTVWTAHRFKVSRETFNELRSLAKSPLLAPHIDYDEITTGAGNETIPFRNGSRIIFAARERGAIRGFTKVRRLILDEGQILTEAAMADLAPTMNQAENPQIIIMGTPPKPSDPGEVFSSLRLTALSGEAEGVLYVEFSADPECESNDWDAVAQANPSYPKRTSKRAILRLRKLLTNDADYRREALGIWDSDGVRDVFGSGKWASARTEHEPPGPPGALAVAASFELTHAAIGGALVDDDGVAHLKSLRHGPGLHWVVSAAKDLQDQHDVDVVIDGKGPAAVLIPALEAAGVRLRIMQTSDVLDACAELFKRVTEKRARHGFYPELDEAVRVAVKRNVGDRWAWGRRASVDDISPLEGVTFASWGASQPAANYSTGWVMSL